MMLNAMVKNITTIEAKRRDAMLFIMILQT